MNLVLDRTQRWMTTTSKWSNHSSIWDPFGIDAPMHLNIYVNYWTSPLSINCTKQGSSNISLWSLDIDSKSGKYAEVFRKKNTTLNLWTNRSSRYVDDHNELGSSWNFWERKEKNKRWIDCVGSDMGLHNWNVARNVVRMLWSQSKHVWVKNDCSVSRSKFERIK